MQRAFEGRDTVWRLLIDASVGAGEHAGPVAVGADLFALLINKSVPFVVSPLLNAAVNGCRVDHAFCGRNTFDGLVSADFKREYHRQKIWGLVELPFH